MKPLILWIDRNKNKIWFSLGLQLLILGVLVLCMEPGFENSLLRENMLSDMTETASFQNYFLRAFYNAVYEIFPALPWYALLQYVLLFTAFFAVTCIILRQLEGMQGIFITVLMMIYFGYECYIRMQDTKTAAILSAAAVFLLIYGAEKKKASWRSLILGVLLGLFGSMYRISQFLICFLLLAWFGAVWLRQETGRHRKEEDAENSAEGRSRCLWIYLGALAVLAVLAGGLYQADKILYAGNESWRADRELYTVREHLRDYGFPDYEENKELYEELNIDEKDLKEYQKKEKNQKKDPLEELSADTMKALAAARPRERLSKALILLFMKKFPVLWFQSRTFLCFLLLAVFWIFWGRHSRGTFLMLLAEAVLTGGMYFCMFYRERNECSQLDMGFWFALCLVMVCCLSGTVWRISGEMKLLLCLSVLIMNQGYWSFQWRIPLKTGKEKTNQEKYYGPFDVRGSGPAEEQSS